jgi:hypothetical protein
MREVVSAESGFDHHKKNEVDWLGTTQWYPVKPLAHFFMVWVRPFKKIGGLGYVLILVCIKYCSVLDTKTKLIVLFLNCKFLLIFFIFKQGI